MRARKLLLNTGELIRLKVLRTPGAGGCPKYRYTTRKLAATAAARQRRSTGQAIYAYSCDRGCHAFHIGHPPGSRGRPNALPRPPHAYREQAAADLEQLAGAAELPPGIFDRPP